MKKEGRIFLDRNNNGVFDDGVDEPVPNVRVFLVPDYEDTISLSDGSYLFEYAYPGSYKVNVDLGWVPQVYELVSADSLDIEVKSKEVTKDIDFIFKRLPEAPIEIKYF